MQTHVRAAHAVGRLRWPSDLVLSPEVAQSLPRRRLLVIASGTQAERPAALVRLATGTHPLLRIEAGDVVVLSSRIIPGNDRPVFDLYASFLRLGVELITRITDRAVHASGHAHRDEQSRMLELTRPRGFVPVHGTLHHLTRHAALARERGVPEILVAEDGDLVELGADVPLSKVGRAPVGRVAAYDGEELSEDVLRERAQIGRAGIAVVSLVLTESGAAAAPPRIVTRGVLDQGDADVPRKASLAVARALEEADARVRAADAELSEVVRLAARRAIEEHTGRRPIVTVALTRL